MSDWRPLFLALALTACSGGKDTTGDGNSDTLPSDSMSDADTDADSDSDTDVEPACDSSIVGVDPEDGAIGVDADATVTVTFDVPITPDQPWSLEVVGATGTTQLAADGGSASWTGTLAPDTNYDVNATVCDDTFASSFKTSPPPVDLLSLEGNSYVLDWDTVTLTEPGQAAVLNTLINVDQVLAQIINVDDVAETAQALATIGSPDAYGNAQPACDLVVAQTADFSKNPYFSIQGDMTIVVDASTGRTATIEDFSLLGMMSADGTAITNVELSGLAATEQFLTNADCNSPLVSILQPTCVPCTTSATGSCMLIEGTAPVANLQPALDISYTCAGYY
jgi:hypothetical protein